MKQPTRAYPWLLLLSTAVAALFCFMYLTKPEFPLAAPLASVPLAAVAKPPVPATAAPALPAAPAPSMLPDAARLPGDARATTAAAKPAQPPGPRPAQAGTAATATFEETNLHIQHVLTAATPGGELSRIVLNVPVLYQSRSLGWTDAEVAEARGLLKRLATYQENSRALREEATQLLGAWNHLVERSIPTPVLRADSPSLPANQDHADRSARAAGFDTTESIQIQPADP